MTIIGERLTAETLHAALHELLGEVGLSSQQDVGVTADGARSPVMWVATSHRGISGRGAPTPFLALASLTEAYFVRFEREKVEAEKALAVVTKAINTTSALLARVQW